MAVREVRAAGIVVFRRVCNELQYLLLQTSYGIHHWTPPKGHVDPGESDLETAYRETKEEAGLNKEDLNLTDFQKALHYKAHGKPKIVTYWLAELKDSSTPVKLSHEHQAYDWFVLDKACEVGGFDDTKELLRACEAYLISSKKC
uniref:Bis(5'-nucleosyl)-tetraphosphatase [asymmetrical] n=1 Tax=Timema monikensis TaxID=170555 RepID=A0A7R9ECF5_9NEOP|nr:unnamed protein product [Timema monikensis]